MSVLLYYNLICCCLQNRTRVFKEKTDLEQKVQSLRHELESAASRCEELELDKRDYLAEYESNLRKLQSQLEQTIQIAKQEQNSCVQKFNAKIQVVNK